jgi:hypothetical protein
VESRPLAAGMLRILFNRLDTGKDGYERRNQHRPEICIKHIDAKRALIGFTARKKPDDEDLIPEVGIPMKSISIPL